MTWFERGRKAPPAGERAFGERSKGSVEQVRWQPVRSRRSRRPPSLRPSTPPARRSVAAVATPEDALVSRPPGPRISVAPPARSSLPSHVNQAEIEEIRARYDESIARLEQAVCDLVDLKERILSHEQERLTELAMAIAKRVVARELKTDATLVAGLAVEGIVALGERDGVTVRVGPMVDEATDAALSASLRTKLPKCEIIRDESLAAGDCVVETSLGRVDESLATRIAAVERALFGEEEDEA